MRFVAAALLAAVLAGCGAVPPAPTDAAPPPSPASATTPPQRDEQAVLRYRCEQGVEFTVRFVDDTAQVDAGARGRETLLRDAGGMTPLHTVWSNARMRAEFGLGPQGREALLQDPAQSVALRCVAV